MDRCAFGDLRRASTKTELRIIVISDAGYSISEPGIFRALTDETDQSVWNFTCLLGRFRHRKPGSHQLFLTPSDALAYIQALYDW